MPLPSINDDGDLPVGIHIASLTETLDLFGQGSSQRIAVADRLARIYKLVHATGCLRRFVVFGSFVTSKDSPQDVDIMIIMEDAFDLSLLSGESAIVFDHMQADTHFGASIFWSRKQSAFGGEQAIIEYWQIRRDGGKRGIVEIVGEPT